MKVIKYIDNIAKLTNILQKKQHSKALYSFTKLKRFMTKRMNLSQAGDTSLFLPPSPTPTHLRSGDCYPVPLCGEGSRRSKAWNKLQGERLH